MTKRSTAKVAQNSKIQFQISLHKSVTNLNPKLMEE